MQPPSITCQCQVCYNWDRVDTPAPSCCACASPIEFAKLWNSQAMMGCTIFTFQMDKWNVCRMQHMQSYHTLFFVENIDLRDVHLDMFTWHLLGCTCSCSSWLLLFVTCMHVSGTIPFDSPWTLGLFRVFHICLGLRCCIFCLWGAKPHSWRFVGYHAWQMQPTRNLATHQVLIST